jgi:methylthioribose-1-phosphate isomerase
MQNFQSDIRPVQYTGTSLKLLDQRLLPNQEVYIEYKTSEEAAKAITDMVVRGAPAIGFAGAWACCLAAKESTDTKVVLQKFKIIKEARPTAVNLAKAIHRMQETLEQNGPENLEAEAQAIYSEDEQMCLAMNAYGLTVLQNKAEYKILTHCNTGSLATAGLGTALGVIKLLAQQRKKLHVYATETRPYLQGARLTAWELVKNDIPVSLIPDSAAAYLMQIKTIDAVFVGADRIVANGDTANKVGTYALALAAKAHSVPFYVVAPATSIDTNLSSGKEIEIEDRSKDELIKFNGVQIAPAQVQVFNPGFDVTPGSLISAFVTDKGVFSADKLKQFFAS